MNEKLKWQSLLLIEAFEVVRTVKKFYSAKSENIKAIQKLGK
jgi:hypothetical protein